MLQYGLTEIGSIARAKIDMAIDALFDIEKKVNPEATDVEILKTVSDLKK